MRGSYYSGGRTNQGGRSNRGSTVIRYTLLSNQLLLLTFIDVKHLHLYLRKTAGFKTAVTKRGILC